MKKILYQNARRPKGAAGRQMIKRMNVDHRAMTDWAFSHIEVGDDFTALDVGCGGGANLSRLCSLCPEGKIYGLDYSDVSVKQSIQTNRDSIRMGKCEVVRGNVCDLKFDDETFELVTGFETIYFWPDIEKAFSHIHRVLKNECVFLIGNETTGEDENAELWPKMIPDINIYTKDELRNLLVDAGFSKVDMDVANGHWLSCVAKK